MNYVIKIKYEDTLRRLTYPGNRPHGEEVGDKLSFPKLEAKIRDLFKLPASAPIRVTYTDKDNDVITMGDDQDLEDACILQGLNPLRLTVTLLGVKSVGTAEGQNEHRPSAPSIKDTVPNMKQMLKGLPADVVKPVVDHVQQLLKGTAASPLQLTELIDTVVHAVTSHTDVAVKKPDLSNNFPAQVSPSSGGLTGLTTSQNSVQPFSLPNASISVGIALPALSAGSDGAHRNPSDNETPGTGNAYRAFHSGVQCDVCGMNPIVGPRFKATKKDDYDLCVSCYKELGNAGDYQRIDRPLFRPRHLRCPAFNPNLHSARVGLPVRGAYGARPEHLRQVIHQTSGKLDARFVQDVTIFDGTELAPLTSFTKIWRLRNSGTLPWPVDTRLVHVGGDELGNVDLVPLELPEKGLAPGEEVEVSVDLVAPEKSGRYVSHWRLASPAGPKFGHRVWVLIQVVSKDGLIDEVSSPSAFATVNKEDSTSTGDSGSGTRGDKASENAAQAVLTGHNLFLAEDYPKGLSSLLNDSVVKSMKERSSEVPSEATRAVGVDVERHTQTGHEVVKSTGSIEDELVAEDNELSPVENRPLQHLRDESAEIELSPLENRLLRHLRGEGAEIELSPVENRLLRHLRGESAEIELSPVENRLLRHLRADSAEIELSPVENRFLQAFKRLDKEMEAGLADVEAGRSRQKVESLTLDTLSAEDASAFVNSELGGFSLVDMPQLVSSSSSGTTVSSQISRGTNNSSSLLTPADSPPAKEEVNAITGEAGTADNQMTSLSLCEQLEGMGFNDRKLNLELLEKNNMDLRRTLDDYFAASEWDPILDELEEMGFYDVEMNRRLMFRNNGSVKRVVKELVQMYKEPVGAVNEKGKGMEVA